MLQLIDEYLLLADHSFYQVTDGYEAHHLFVIEDGQVSDTFVRH